MALIDSIIADRGLEGTITKPVPAKAHVILLAHKDQPRFTLDFNYQSVMGKLNYIAQTSPPRHHACCPPDGQILHGPKDATLLNNHILSVISHEIKRRQNPLLSKSKKRF